MSITTQDIDRAIKDARKIFKETMNPDEYKAARRSYNKMLQDIREHPDRHYHQIMQLVEKNFQEIDHKFWGMFENSVEEYLLNGGAQLKRLYNV